MKIIGRIVCFFKGHKRGKFLIQEHTVDGIFNTFNCPRCTRTTRYKVKPKSENNGAPADGSASFREAS